MSKHIRFYIILVLFMLNLAYSTAQEPPVVNLVVLDDFNSDTYTYLRDIASLVLAENSEDVYQTLQYLAENIDEPTEENILWLENTVMQASWLEIIQPQLVELGGLGDACTIHVDDLRYATQGLNRGGNLTGIPHGNMVLDVISSTDNTFFISGQIGGLNIVPVDTQGFNLEVIIQELNTVMSDNSQYYVVNMSFGIIPCEHLPFFVASQTMLGLINDGVEGMRYPEFANLADIIGNSMGSYYDRNIKENEILQNCDGLCGEFLNQINDYGSDSNVVMIAAAGNSSYDYSFYPGAFDQVISVSAGQEQVDDFTIVAPFDWSNSGEVLMLGTTAIPDTVGTSFAAPRLSIWAAFYMAINSGDICRQERPAIHGVFYPAIGYDGFDNKSMSDASSSFCDEFLP